MGIFSKLWKGVKKTFKKIFKPIKKVFKSVGKFMNKIGIVGQLAMSFILPGIGNALIGAYSGMVSSLAAGSLGTIGKAAGWVLGKAGQFAKTISTGFKTVTSAVTDFIGATGKWVGGKLGSMGIGKMKDITLRQAFGAEGWAGKLVENFTKFTDSATGLFTDGLSDFASKGIMTPAEIAARQEIPVEDLSTQAREIDQIDGRAAPPEVINTVDTLDPNRNYRMSDLDGAPYEVAPDTTRSMLADPAAPAADTSNRLLDNVKRGNRIRAATPPSTIRIPEATSASATATATDVATDVATDAATDNMGFFEKVTGKKDMRQMMTDAPGDLLEYGAKSVLGLPGQMAQGQLMSLIQGEPDPYEQGPLWGGSTYAYQSFDYNQLAGGNSPLNNFENYTAFNDYNNMYNNEPRGQYGGIDAFNAFSQRGTA